MPTYFITRHRGAIDWAEKQGFHIDSQLAHLEIEKINKGDRILGTLPINLVAQVNDCGAHYFHLSLDLPAELRGKELSHTDMEACNARLEEYTAQRVEP